MTNREKGTISLREAFRLIGIGYATGKRHLEQTGEVYPGVRPVRYGDRLLVPRWALETALGKAPDHRPTRPHGNADRMALYAVETD